MERINKTTIPEQQLVLTESIRKLLYDFRHQLLSEILLMLSEKKPSDKKQWLKSAEVRKLLGISHGTLQAMRNNGTIPFTRIGGVIYYSRKELDKMLGVKPFVSP